MQCEVPGDLKAGMADERGPFWRGYARAWPGCVSQVGRNGVLCLCNAVLGVDAVPAEKVTESLDLIAQGREGCPLL